MRGVGQPAPLYKTEVFIMANVQVYKATAINSILAALRGVGIIAAS